jgi:hypothetical protein
LNSRQEMDSGDSPHRLLRMPTRSPLFTGAGPTFLSRSFTRSRKSVPLRAISPRVRFLGALGGTTTILGGAGALHRCPDLRAHQGLKAQVADRGGVHRHRERRREGRRKERRGMACLLPQGQRHVEAIPADDPPEHWAELAMLSRVPLALSKVTSSTRTAVSASSTASATSVRACRAQGRGIVLA